MTRVAPRGAAARRGRPGRRSGGGVGRDRAAADRAARAGPPDRRSRARPRRTARRRPPSTSLMASMTTAGRAPSRRVRRRGQDPRPDRRMDDRLEVAPAPPGRRTRSARGPPGRASRRAAAAQSPNRARPRSMLRRARGGDVAAPRASASIDHDAGRSREPAGDRRLPAADRPGQADRGPGTRSRRPLLEVEPGVLGRGERRVDVGELARDPAQLDEVGRDRPGRRSASSRWFLRSPSRVSSASSAGLLAPVGVLGELRPAGVVAPAPASRPAPMPARRGRDGARRRAGPVAVIGSRSRRPDPPSGAAPASRLRGRRRTVQPSATAARHAR